MSTTNLFVELLVIGIGCAGWLVLLTVSVLGYNPNSVRVLLSTPVLAIPALVVVYLFGIVVDRVADASLHALRAERRCRKYYATEEESLKERVYVLSKSSYFASQFDYSRSRQRICRGWIINALLLLVSLYVLQIARPGLLPHAGRVLGLATPVLIVLAVACWFAWERLADTELKRIRDQAKWLREEC